MVESLGNKLRTEMSATESGAHSKSQENVSLTIETPSGKDAREIRELIYRTWQDTYPNEEFGVTRDHIDEHFKDLFTEDSLTRFADRLDHPPEGALTFVARHNEHLVGVCGVIQHAAYNELVSMNVDPAFQGVGIGYALWEEAKNNLNLSKDTILHVTSYNIKAIDFYTRLGFAATDEITVDKHFKLTSGANLPQIKMILKAQPTST